MRNKDQYNMMEVDHQEYIATINISNHKYMWTYFRVPKYIKPITTYLKGEIHSNTIKGDKFSMPLSAIDCQTEN